MQLFKTLNAVKSGCLLMQIFKKIGKFQNDEGEGFRKINI